MRSDPLDERARRDALYLAAWRERAFRQDGTAQLDVEFFATLVRTVEWLVAERLLDRPDDAPL